MQTTLTTHQESVNRAFSKQSADYDAHDEANPILRDMRQQVYRHLGKFLKPNSNILELNAGTGIDALHLISLGHRVHAIDIADGMIEQIGKKQSTYDLAACLTFQRLSYAELDRIEGKKFDYIFSNFGGLNCIRDLPLITKHFPDLLKKGSRITLVIMPRLCPWELVTILKGNMNAFRRLKRNGVLAHLEGEYFQTYYHSLNDIKKAFGPRYEFLKSESLGIFSPQPHQVFLAENHPGIYNSLRKVDAALRNHFPFNRWGDHIIVTFERVVD